MDVAASPASGQEHGRALLAEVACQVERLIASGKCKQAVELAKDEHKRRKTPDSEQMLVNAYLARIAQFQQKGAVQDAQTLLKLVRDRFPSHRGSLADLELRSAAIAGNIDDLVSPLVRSDLPQALRTRIESLVRQHVADLPSLAQCCSLAPEHPLRTAAAAARLAFEAVTAGPVNDEQIALPQISRRGPLAGWKLLVRAIAAFYRGDDAGCRQALSAIPEDAATRRLAGVLGAMIEGKPPGIGRAGALQGAIGGDDRPLRQALEGIERAFDHCDLFSLRRNVRQAMQACAAVHPQLCERLRQHLSARCLLEEVPVDEVTRMIGPAGRDAYMWRMLAMALESRGDATLAVLHWERFLRHAVEEGLVRAGSPEAAAVYLHMAELLARVPPEQLDADRRELSRTRVFGHYYQGQPPHILALAPASDREVVERTLDPNGLYTRAAEICPDAQTFQQWWKWASDSMPPGGSLQNVALTWNLKRPQDYQPLLHLSMLAEHRGALKLALKYLGEAEAINPMNPQVRKARARLTLGRTWRHFKDRKPHLVEKDLAELETLSVMQEGDRQAFLRALRAADHALRCDKAAAAQAYEAVVQRLGMLGAAVIMDSVAKRTGVGQSAHWPLVRGVALPDPHAVVEAEARTIRLAIDLELQIWRPESWDAIINDVLGERPCRLSHPELLAIGCAAKSRGDALQAYLASAAGLSSASGPPAARFLLMRARSLPRWAPRRISQCLRAAGELARQMHDPELMSEVSEEIDNHAGVRRDLSRGTGGGDLGAELLSEIVKAECEAQTPPRDAAAAERHVVAIESEVRWGDQSADDEERATEDALDVDDVPPPANLSPEMKRELERVLKRFGRPLNLDKLMRQDPRLLVQLLQTMFDIGLESEMPGPGGGGGRRRH